MNIIQKKRFILEMIAILNNKNSINKRSYIWIVFLMFIKHFQRKTIFRKYLYFLFELKVISSPGQFIQWPVIKIFNFLGLFSKHQRKQLFFFHFSFFQIPKKNLLLIKGEFLLKRLVSINFSRLFYKDLYFFIYIYVCIAILWVRCRPQISTE